MGLHSHGKYSSLFTEKESDVDKLGLKKSEELSLHEKCQSNETKDSAFWGFLQTFCTALWSKWRFTTLTGCICFSCLFFASSFLSLLFQRELEGTQSFLTYSHKSSRGSIRKGEQRQANGFFLCSCMFFWNQTAHSMNKSPKTSDWVPSFIWSHCMDQNTVAGVSQSPSWRTHTSGALWSLHLRNERKHPSALLFAPF